MHDVQLRHEGSVLCTNPQVFTADVEIGCNLPEGIYIETSVYITIYDGVRTSLNTGANKLSVSYPTVTAIQKTGGGLPATTGEQRSDFWILVRPRHADRWDGAHQRPYDWQRCSSLAQMSRHASRRGTQAVDVSLGRRI